MKLRTALLAATFIAAPVLLPGGAKAQPVTGPYVSAGIGYNKLDSEKLKSLTTGGETVNLGDSHALFSGGYTGEAAIGYGLGNGFRVELEGDYFNNQVKKVDLGANQSIASGNERKYGAMVNGYYDFDVGVPYMYPFVGAGVGYQWANWRDVRAPNAGPGITGINNTEGSFAYQGIVGVSFPIPSMPGLSADVQYRYMGTTGNRTYSGYAGGAPASLKVGREGNNMVLVGMRYELFPPAPPAPAPTPVAAPAPAPARTYLVFFNWNSAALTPRAKQIVGEAAQASQSSQVTKLNVNGYTDTSGAAKYNMKLSLRRASHVASELVSDGVPKQDIVIKGYGQTHLLVPTGPNVREPQNRRVEIILH